MSERWNLFLFTLHILSNKCPTRWNDGSITADGPPSETSPGTGGIGHCINNTEKKKKKNILKSQILLSVYCTNILDILD